jgi:hypothetical protein
MTRNPKMRTQFPKVLKSGVPNFFCYSRKPLVIMLWAMDKAKMMVRF